MPRGWTKCLPISLWPSADQAAWAKAIRPRNPFDEWGIAAHWSPATRRKIIAGYGRFLFWLKERNELDETVGPAERITRERLTAYLEDLRNINRGHTIQCRIQELGDAMRALAPECDWGFIKRAAARLRGNTIPARDKRRCLLPIADVITLGSQMLKRAEENEALSEIGRAALYRDGLVLLFLAHHPMRLRNFSSLRIGHQLIAQGPAFFLNIDASETKAWQGSQQELSERLSFAVRRYIATYRPVLLQAKGRWHAKVLDELWISRNGSPCNPQTLRNIVKKHLVGPNGEPISPHLFRTMAATAVSIEAPGSVDIIPAILNHRSHRTAERYYNFATSLDASRAFAIALDSIRMKLRLEEQKDRYK
jgi:integrase/recombinase XerD